MSTSGGHELLPADVPTSEMTKEVMRKFNVDKETAERIIADRNVFALEKMNKWTFNMKKRQKGKGRLYLSANTKSKERKQNCDR